MKVYRLSSESEQVVQGDGAQLELWSRDSQALLWVHLDGAVTKEQEKMLRDRFGIHQLAINDAKRDRHPPKLEEFSNATFLLFKVLSEESEDIHFSTIQLAVFVGDRFLVTRSSGPCQAIARLERELGKSSKRFAKGPSALATRLIRLFIDRYLEILLGLEPRLEELEEGLLAKTDDEVLVELTGYKTELKKLRRIFLYHEQILSKLCHTPCAGFAVEQKHELTDVYEQQERANSLTLLYYELAADLNDGYLSMFSHRLNRIMQVLTVVTVVFVPLSFLAGIYGMNFENMPELNSRWGYFILLTVMACIATTLLLVFRKRKWL